MIGGCSPEAYEKPLHEYQKTAVTWLLRRLFAQRQMGGGLFLDPGLGKTRITLATIDALCQFEAIKRVLIVAPLRPVYSVWPKEMRRWGFPQSNIVLHDQYAKALSYGLQVEMVNFAGLKRLQNVKKRWDMVVVDESTFVKTFTSKRAQFLRKMCKTIPRRIILTGTPASNSLADLHSQAFFLDNGLALGKNCGAFRGMFCQPGGWYGRKWLVREEMKEAIKDAMKHLVLTMKAEDYLDMPKLVENNIWCTLPKSAYTEYKALKRELFLQLQSGEIMAANQASAYGKCRQFANGQVYDADKVSHAVHDEKLKALFELHEELAGKPLLIAYHFSHDADRIKNAAGSPFKKTPVIRGGMKSADVDKIMDEWNAGKHHALIAQIQAVSHGNNLQYGGCADVAYFGIPDSLDFYEQFYRRIYRQGNEEPHVRLHRFLVEGTVEELQVERLYVKDQTQAAFLRALQAHVALGA